ncbi:hypothetical protein H8U31_001342 [Salmonella enterica]|nr:hypothetical protein [Salmonella enterica]
MPPIDERTTRFDLELPAEANTLKNDVARLRDSFGKLDTNAAKLDANGKLEETQIPDSVARLNTVGLLKDDQLPLKVPLLDAAGKLPQSTIPDDARMNIMNAASEVLMLDLNATLGDVCNITQSPYKQYLLVKPDPTQRDSWRELPDKAVTSVNGRTGAVTVAEAGVNADITGLTSLSGPLTLGGDAAGAYDAVTLRQLQAASGGAGGANMSGVMNNFIGAVEWFNGSRAKLPAGYIAADGQLASRTDAATKDLWAAVDSQMLVSVTDALWLDSGFATAPTVYRGSYSTGDGSTTFRVPDLNGIVADSIGAVFLRGSSKDTASHGSSGSIYPNRAPNIKGTLSHNYSNTVAIWDGGTGPFSVIPPNVTKLKSFGDSLADAQSRPTVAQFDASSSSPAYGRISPDGVTPSGEIAPNAATGIWIIRASGTFAAQNTNFNVIAGDTTAPAAGTLIEGGEIVSQYQIAGATHIKSVFQVKGKYLQDGWSEHSLVQANGTVAATASLRPGSNYTLSYPRGSGTQVGPQFISQIDTAAATSIYTQYWSSGALSTFFNMYKPGDASYKARTMELTDGNDLILPVSPTSSGSRLGGSFISKAGPNNEFITWFKSYYTPGVDDGAVINADNSSGTACAYYFLNSSVTGEAVGKISSSKRGLVMFEGSDARWKKNKVPVKPGCLERIERVEVCEYDWIDGGYHERGWIAQQLQEVDPQYVTGTDKLSVSTKALIADLIGSVQTLSARVKELEKSKK